MEPRPYFACQKRSFKQKANPLFSLSLAPIRFIKSSKIREEKSQQPQGSKLASTPAFIPPPLGHSKKMAGILFRMKIFDILQALLNFYLLTRNRFWNFSFIIIITPFTPSHTSSPSSAPPLSPDGRTQCFSFFSLVFRFLSLI